MKLLDTNQLLEGIRNANVSILGKAITLIESTLPEHRKIALDLLDQCLPFTGNTYRIGITGTPGVGKSSFIDAFGMYLINKGFKIAVLAIDPTSQKNGGSILGDKTRMNRLSVHNQAFIRPSPSGNQLGGVARHTRETLLLCEAAGYNIVFIETVGVGQSEVMVRSMSDFFLLLVQPGAGDELQGIKRGIMEMADGLIINKSDGDLLPAARKTQVDYQYAIHYFPKLETGWQPQSIMCSSINETGMEAVWNMLLSYQSVTQKNNYWHQNRKSQMTAWFTEEREQLVLEKFYLSHQNKIKELENKILAGKMSPSTALQKLFNL